MDLLKVALTSIVSVAALFLLTKLMGNKQISQLSMFDYIIGISIGSIAAEFATELENPERTLLAMIIYALSAWLVSLITSKSTHIRKLISGKPLILFDKGRLYRENFRKARLDLTDFLTQCRSKGFFDLSQVQTAVFEYNGSISILPVEKYRPMAPQDMNLNPTQQELIVNVILDGCVNEENLKLTGNDPAWLSTQLKLGGFESPQEVYLACVNTVDNTITMYAAATGKNSADPFE